jgi:redox-sensitive bicupin YhaK (pirin superfamily)
MPAVTTDNPLVLPRVAVPAPDAVQRPVTKVVTAGRYEEGAGFAVRRPFPDVSLAMADPFLLLDHLGSVEYAPGEARGAPWHPHRGFETVTYVLDGALAHHDSNGGGGLITDGDTQWMTAGAGILHDELPTEELVTRGGRFHAVQLWVNLPRALKFAEPRYQDLRGSDLTLLSSHDGGALIRLIAGELDGRAGPGATRTPILYAHATVSPGARVSLPWPRAFNALAYALSGSGRAGTGERPFREGQLAVYGTGDAITLTAGERQDTRSPNLEVLLLGGLPLHEPVARYGPFVMNTRKELIEAYEDFQAGRMGVIPAARLAPGAAQTPADG